MLKGKIKTLCQMWCKKRIEGVGVVETVLILVVLLGVVVIFRTQLTALVRTIFSTLTDSVNNIL